MKNVFIIVEGYTELEFVKNIISPHLIQNGAIFVNPYPVTTNSDLGKKGGGKSYKHLREDLLKSVKYNSTKIVTTFFDFYGLPDDFPQYTNCRNLIKTDEKIVCLENAIKQDIAPNNHLFLPYIQKHEFEALLFSSNKGFEKYFDTNTAEKTKEIIDSFETPEEINDSKLTAPSKRLETVNPDYEKVIYGNIITLEIGIETMLEKCPRFKDWIETIIEKVNS